MFAPDAVHVRPSCSAQRLHPYRRQHLLLSTALFRRSTLLLAVDIAHMVSPRGLLSCAGASPIASGGPFPVLVCSSWRPARLSRSPTLTLMAATSCARATPDGSRCWLRGRVPARHWPGLLRRHNGCGHTGRYPLHYVGFAGDQCHGDRTADTSSAADRARGADRPSDLATRVGV